MTRKAIYAADMRRDLADRLFIGCYPVGFVYADRAIERRGDYKDVAFLPYDTLELAVRDPASPLLSVVQAHAARMRSMRGERYQIAGNMTITLGTKMRVDTLEERAAEELFDRCLERTSLGGRGGRSLGAYAATPADTEATRAYYTKAVRAARVGDEAGCAQELLLATMSVEGL